MWLIMVEDIWSGIRGGGGGGGGGGGYSPQCLLLLINIHIQQVLEYVDLKFIVKQIILRLKQLFHEVYKIIYNVA